MDYGGNENQDCEHYQCGNHGTHSNDVKGGVAPENGLWCARRFQPTGDRFAGYDGFSDMPIYRRTIWDTNPKTPDAV